MIKKFVALESRVGTICYYEYSDRDSLLLQVRGLLHGSIPICGGTSRNLPGGTQLGNIKQAFGSELVANYICDWMLVRPFAYHDQAM